MPTPVQSETIPVVLNGHDLLVGAETGSGKTAAFVIPVLQQLLMQRIEQKGIRTLVLTPTRELAIQVYDGFKQLGQHTPIKIGLVYGGVSMQKQIHTLQKGCHILVATPGRLLDLYHQKQLDFSLVDQLVLDEADRMLDMGFIKDVRKIINSLPRQRQTMLFSATYNSQIKTLASQILTRHQEIAVSKPNQTAKGIKQQVYGIQKENKRELLAWLIDHERWQQVLIFVRTRHGANRLQKQLMKDGIRCMAIHGDKSQAQRIKALEQFKSGKTTALIATDIAARGIDIQALPYVVNFDLPRVAADYIHRIGRTGRAGETGLAISLVTAEEISYLTAIEKLMKEKIPQVKETGYEFVDLAEKPKHSKRKSPSIKKNTGVKKSESRKYQKPRKNKNRFSKKK